METALKLGLNPKSIDIHTLHELVPLIELQMNIDRGALTSGAPADHPRFTLVMTSPGIWQCYLATPTQNIAFNTVNNYLVTHTLSYDMLQTKRFRVTNRLAGKDNITVIIEVKEMNDNNTLKRAIYKGESLSEFELLDTEGAANDRKRAKEANYNQVTSSGPGYGYYTDRKEK
jgi:hypothetical protein